MVKIGDNIKITDAHEFNAYAIGDIMIVSGLLTEKVFATDMNGEEHAIWNHCYELIDE